MDVQRYFQRIPAQLVLVAVSALAAAQDADVKQGGPRFYPDDPVCCAPKPRNVATIEPRKTDTLFDFLYNSFVRVPAKGNQSGGINTLGEVLDSEWFTNRHGRKRLTAEELHRGPGDGDPPQPPYVVVGAKLDGITPGFRMRDSRGTLYFIKPDPLSNPEMATAADVIGARFFHAIGYNTPENYISFIKPEEMTVSPDATRVGDSGKPRPMTMADIRDILWKVPRVSDGSYRVVASRAVEGKPLGPFRYKGARTDDPNDVVPHEDRRDLRGLFVFCAWLNHTDAKSINSLDTLVKEGDTQYVRHYLIDFGSSFGSDSDMAKNARFGNGYIIPTAGEIGHGIADLGIVGKPWERADYPDLPSIGRFESQAFEPEKWVPNYPNFAFDQRTPEDEYWAAKIVMAFADEDIREVVKTARYSDPRATDYMAKTLMARREAIGRTYFKKVLALEELRMEKNSLEFTDLEVSKGFAPPRQYNIQWFLFDNARNALTPIGGATSRALPIESASAPNGSYLAAKVVHAGDGSRGVTAYFRKGDGQYRLVGIDRQWKAPAVGGGKPETSASAK